jgi:hypothetical protein
MNMMTKQSVWERSQYRGEVSIVGHTEKLRIELVPSRGSKVVSLINLETGKEWVFQNDEPWMPLQYGMDWGAADRMGWDEMFPTILPCPCPNAPWQHVSFPDHGEVWALPWEYKQAEDRITLWVSGVQVPYKLEKTYSLCGSSVNIDYKVSNPTPFDFSYMWAAHNLLHVMPGTELITESHLDQVTYYFSQGNRVAHFNERAKYPIAMGNEGPVNLSVTEQKLNRHAEKYWFQGDLKDGIAGVRAPSGETLMYSFSPEDVPYLAVWANYGAFWGEYNVAFEPATGFLDNLYIAHQLHKVKTVQGYSEAKWRLSIELIP